MDKFLERHKLPTLKQEEIENMTGRITGTKIETVIKKIPKYTSPGSDSFTGKFYQIFREDLTPILLEFFQKIAEERTLPSSFYKATITLLPKPDKDMTKKRKLQVNIIGEYRCKNPQQNTSKPNQFFNICRSISVIHHH